MIDLFFLYMFIKRLVTPFDKWKAFEAGIIDDEGNIIKAPEVRKRTIKDREAFTKFDLMVLKLKKLLAKVPGGQTRFATYAAALWLVKEHKDPEAPILNEQATVDSIMGYMTQLEENHDVNLKFEELFLEDGTMSAGGGAVAGIGVGPDGEPGFSAKQMTKHKKKNKSVAMKSFKIHMQGTNTQ